MKYVVGSENKIREVRFGVAGDEYIRKSAAATISEQTLYSRSIPNPNGVNSLLMGASSRMLLCSTCGNSIETCPGHPGVLHLAAPVFSALFFDFTVKKRSSVPVHFAPEFCSARTKLKMSKLQTLMCQIF